MTVDPSWAPGGTTLAFVRAPERTRSSFEQSAVAGWYGAHQLWLYALADRSLHEVGAAAGATAPTWSSDGKTLELSSVRAGSRDGQEFKFTTIEKLSLSGDGKVLTVARHSESPRGPQDSTLVFNK